MTLQKFISKNEFNYTTLTGLKFYVNDTQYDEFFDEYYNSNSRTVTEKHLDNKCKLLIDIDLKSKNSNRTITNKHISTIVSTINDLLDMLFIEPNKKCYIFQRSKPYSKDNYFKDGIHIIYPYIITFYELLFVIRKRLLKNLIWLEEHSYEKIDSIIDEAVIKSNNWFLYKSSKPNIEPYEITKIYSESKTLVQNNKSDLDLIKLFSIRYKLDNETKLSFDKNVLLDYYYRKENKVEDKEYDNIVEIYNSDDKEKIRYMLMNILKKERADNYVDWRNIGLCLHNINNSYLDLWIEFSKRSEKYKIGECEKLWNKFLKNNNGLKIGSLYYYSKMDNIDKLKDLNVITTIREAKGNFPDNDLNIKNIFRNNNYVLVDLLDKYCPIFQGDHTKEYVYIEMSPKYGMVLKCRCEECKGKLYPSDTEIKLSVNNIQNIFNINITNNNYNINDEELELEYLEVTDDEELNKLITESLNGNNSTVYDIANVMFYLYKDSYRYDNSNNTWYLFEQRWKSTNNLRTKISKNILDIYKKSKTKINKIDDEKIRKIKLKKVNNLIDNLKTTAFKNNIITECAEIFSENYSNISNNLDSNPYLLGFNNGVFDLNNNIFREGKVEDYISMSVGYDYSTELNKNNIKRLNKFLEEIQPDKNDRDYLLTYLSTCLFGINELQHFVVLTGKHGRNGKSKLTDLISVTFGDYFSSIKSKMLTKPSPDAQTPDPMLLDLMKKRLVVTSEPEKGDKLNTGYIKLLTGKDKAKVRKCHSNDMIEFTINFRTILLCNDIPIVDNPNDQAYQRRLKCINFPFEFVDNPKEPNQKLVDHSLIVEDLRLEFINLLLEYYSNYKKNGLPKNENILKFTEKVNSNNNIGLVFMNECTEEAPTHMHTCKIYEAFKEWFKINYPTEKIPSNREFINNIKQKYTICDSVRMKGTNGSTMGIKKIKIKEILTYDDNTEDILNFI